MKKSKLVTIVGGSVVALATALGGTYYATRPISNQFTEQNYEKNTEYKREYTLDDFKRVLGDRVIPERADELERMWKSNEKRDIESRQLLTEIYTRKSIKEVSIPEAYKNDYESFDPNKISEKKLSEYKSRVQWKVEKTNGKYEESDKKMLYVLSKVDEAINEVAAESIASAMFGIPLTTEQIKKLKENKK